MSFWGGHFYCLFYSEKALDLWLLSQFFQIVDSGPTYFIKRKMKGIRYISTVLHYSSCMKRQSKMAASHAAIALWIIQMLFLSLFIVWWCLNQLKQIKVGNKLIEFPISLAENLIQIAAGLPVHHTMKTSRVMGLMPVSHHTFVLGLPALQGWSCYFIVQGCCR